MAVVAAEPITSKSWAIPPRKDQGSTSMCVGMSLRNLLDGAPVQTKKGPTPADIYHAAQLIDEWPGEDYEGTSVLAGCKVLEKLGHISWYGWAFDAETAARWISKVSPVVFGIRWTVDMFRPDPKTHLIRPTGATAGGHAIHSYRYDAKRGLFWLNQSWGLLWPGSYKGLCCILGEDVDVLLKEGGECATVKEQRLQRVIKAPPPEGVVLPQNELEIGKDLAVVDLKARVG